jgi:hypothetical protein
LNFAYGKLFEKKVFLSGFFDWMRKNKSKSNLCTSCEKTILTGWTVPLFVLFVPGQEGSILLLVVPQVVEGSSAPAHVKKKPF